MFFQRAGEFCEVTGDLAGDGGTDFRGVEREIGPNPVEALANAFLREVGEADTEATRVGERQVGFSGLGEVGEDFDAVADIDNEEKGRAGFVGGERTGIAFKACALARIIASSHEPVPRVGPDFFFV